MTTDEDIIRHYYQVRANLPDDTSDKAIIRDVAEDLELNFDDVARVITAHWFPCA